MDYTNTGLYRFIYGLYQYMDYTKNERVKRVLYTIYQYLKRYHHITLPQDERTTTNNIFIPERPQPIKCRTIYHR